LSVRVKQSAPGSLLTRPAHLPSVRGACRPNTGRSWTFSQPHLQNPFARGQVGHPEQTRRRPTGAARCTGRLGNGITLAQNNLTRTVDSRRRGGLRPPRSPHPCAPCCLRQRKADAERWNQRRAKTSQTSCSSCPTTMRLTP
jgi:hypothetical protein